MRDALKQHWPEYLMEAAGLGLFMVSACAFGVLLDHPASPAYHWLPNPLVRRVLTGVAMGLTLVCLVYSPWGKQSGAHMNPAVTLTFLRLGKVRREDALFYIMAQFAGGILGVTVASLPLRTWLGHPAVNYAATVPHGGVTAALLAETHHQFCVDDDDSVCLEQGEFREVHWTSCGHTRRHLHHPRITDFWNEHEPGAHHRLSGLGKHVDGCGSTCSCRRWPCFWPVSCG